MSRLLLTEARSPGQRGLEFGREAGERIRESFDNYMDYFCRSGALDAAEVRAFGEEALRGVAEWAPKLALEMEGTASGADLDPWQIGAMNARTEILARAASRRAAGECSVVLSLDLTGGHPTAVQTWDWYEEFADLWLVHGFTDGETGIAVRTVTEAGILAKIGVNSEGVGVMLNLLHHCDDGKQPITVPIHVLLRRILSDSSDIFDALHLIASVTPAAGSAVTVFAEKAGEDTGVTAELIPGGSPGYVLPDQTGLLLHTNHYLSPFAAADDREPTIGPDSFIRYERLRREVTPPDRRSSTDIVNAMNSHIGAGGALCCHPEDSSPPGERYATLATVAIHPSERSMSVLSAGPCGSTTTAWKTVTATTQPD